MKETNKDKSTHTEPDKVNNLEHPTPDLQDEGSPAAAPLPITIEEEHPRED